jgi:hypothetical protein
MKNNANPWQWYLKSFLWIYIIFTGIIAFVAYAGLDKEPRHTVLVIKTTLCSISGPMTGAIARDYQSCCLKFCQGMLKKALPILLLGLTACIFIPSNRRWIGRTVWVLSWLVWFFFGLISMLHAIS